MENWIVVGVLILIIGGAGFYVYKAKKSGKKCIGCPESSSCSSSKEGQGCSGCCAQCHCSKDQ